MHAHLDLEQEVVHAGPQVFGLRAEHRAGVGGAQDPDRLSKLLRELAGGPARIAGVDPETARRIGRSCRRFQRLDLAGEVDVGQNPRGAAYGARGAHESEDGAGLHRPPEMESQIRRSAQILEHLEDGGPGRTVHHEAERSL